MAWESYSSDILLDLPRVTCGGYCDVQARVAYRLYCDTSDANNTKIRIELTYVHMKCNVVPASGGGGYWNSVACSWFLGAYPSLFNQSQYNLNSQRDEHGYYIHPFAWPYVGVATGSNSDYPLPVGYGSSISDLTSVAWNNSPVVALSIRDDTQSLGASRVSYGQTAADLDSTSACVAWGQVFSNKDKFNGVNSNGQSKVYVTSSAADFATSSVKRKSTGQTLPYNSEWSVGVSDLQVVSPYTGSQCFAYVETSANELESRGLIKYDPDFFTGDGVSQNYVINGYIVPLTWWVRSYNAPTNYYSTLRRQTNSENQIVLKYEEFDVPEYDPPDPVGSIDDNTVFRLKKQYDSSGHVIVDQNGNPRLAWVKCERMGQE